MAVDTLLQSLCSVPSASVTIFFSCCSTLRFAREEQSWAEQAAGLGLSLLAFLLYHVMSCPSSHLPDNWLPMVQQSSHNICWLSAGSRSPLRSPGPFSEEEFLLGPFALSMGCPIFTPDCKCFQGLSPCHTVTKIVLWDFVAVMCKSQDSLHFGSPTYIIFIPLAAFSHLDPQKWRQTR